VSSRGVIRFLVSLPATALVGAVILSLLGYGAASAIENTFGMPRNLTYDSPLDLLHLASHAIAGWMEILVDLWMSLPFWQLVLKMSGIGLVMTVLMLVSRVFATHKGARKALTTVLAKVRRFPGLDLMLSCGHWLRKEKLSLIPLAACSIAPWLVVLLIALALLLFTALPVMGHNGAMKHLHTWTIAAEYCTPLSSRDNTLNSHNRSTEKGDQESSRMAKAKMTPCLSLWKNGSLIAEGRHVASTASHIVLFDPATGDVRREPTDGVSVHVSGMSAPALLMLIKSSNTHE
jgi:hypothetical protein